MISISPWRKLHQDIVAWKNETELAPKAVLLEIKNRIRQLAEWKLCNAMAQHWIMEESAHICVSSNADARTLRGDGAIQLKGPFSQNATVLAISILLSPVHNSHRLRSYSMAIEQAGGSGWQVRIDLDPQQAGVGPCTHPALHCHYGHRDVPEARCPLPPLMPWDALDWLVTMVDANLEPAPWKAK